MAADEIVIPAGLVKIDAPETRDGWCLVERDSPAHVAAMAKAEKPEKKAK